MNASQCESVTLRIMGEECLEDGLSLLTNPIIKQTYMLPDFPSRVEAEALFHRLKDISRQVGRYVRGVFLGQSMIGFLNDVEITQESIELGWVIHPEHHNKGYATSAVMQAIKELFALGYAEVTAGAFVENPASIRVMEKCGMTRLDKTEEIEYRGAAHRCVYYAIRRNA